MHAFLVQENITRLKKTAYISGQRCVKGRGTCGKYSIRQLNRSTEKFIKKSKVCNTYGNQKKAVHVTKLDDDHSCESESDDNVIRV